MSFLAADISDFACEALILRSELSYQNMTHADHPKLCQAYTRGVTFQHERVIGLSGAGVYCSLHGLLWFTSLDLGFDVEKD
jgi:hypothetical protein